jgi:hypothetical protein
MQGQYHLNLDVSQHATKLFDSLHQVPGMCIYQRYIANIGRLDLLGCNESLLISGIGEKLLALLQDTTIADIAIVASIGQIKTGSMSQTDRICKYNQLKNISAKRPSGPGKSYYLP